jgi:hypothetical protein
MQTTEPWRVCQDADVGVVQAHAMSLVKRLCNALPRRAPTIAVAVLTAQRRRRRTLRREIVHAAQQLERTSPIRQPVEAGVIVQQCLGSERPLPGCYQIGQRSDGSCRVLFRLAMAVNGRCLDIDSILAVFAEEWIGFVSQQAEGPSVSVPIDLLSTAPTVNGREADSHPNGWDSANLTGRVA